MKVAIAGTGYVGLCTAVVLAKIGNNVTCVDVDKKKIEMLSSGKPTFYEDGLPEMLAETRANLRFTTDFHEAYSNADIIIIAVGTPEKIDGSANLSFVYDVAKQIADSVRHECVVVMKSTVPIGTGDKIENYIKSLVCNGIDISVVSNPEFLSQGTAINDMSHASRIIVGTSDKNARDKMKKLYVPLGSPIVWTDRRSAEMIKYASNDFLALKISYINEIANICELLDANVEDVARGMGMDPRIGDKFLKAGIGYGGSCFPKDTKALHWLSNFNDYEIKTVKAAIEVNENQKIKLLKKMKKYYPDVAGLQVAVLGLTFKPGTDDLRESPSLSVVPMLLENGASVRAWDPYGANKFASLISGDIKFVTVPRDAVDGADVCLILTDWKQVCDMTWEDFSLMRQPVVLDGRNCFEISDMEKLPIVYDSIGRPAVQNITISNI